MQFDGEGNLLSLQATDPHGVVIGACYRGMAGIELSSRFHFVNP